LYLKKGGTFEGKVKSENEDSVEFDIGFGTITFSKQEVQRIERSTPEEMDKLTRDWTVKKEELKKQEKDFFKEREERFKEYEKWSREERERKAKETLESKEIKVARDVETNSILVEGTVDERVHVSLVLDTGASLVVLSKRKGEELGLDLSDTNKDILELHMAGNRKVKAKAVVLKSLKIKDIEEKNVMAAVLLEDTDFVGFRDGLLGRTFLNRFNINIDLKNMTMALEKLG